MNKPVQIQTITIHHDGKMTQEQLQKYTQMIREKNDREIRDYGIYRKGVSDGRGLFSGLLGL